MLGVNKVCIFTIHVEDILEHPENELRDGENLAKGTDSELFRDSDK